MMPHAAWRGWVWLPILVVLATIWAGWGLQWSMVGTALGKGSSSSSPTASLTSTLTPQQTITETTLTPTPAAVETLPTLPVETPTPTITPTPRPVYLPLLFRFRRSLYLLNGDFESGAFLPGWRESGVLARSIVGGRQQHSGQYAALLGSPNYNSRGGCPTGEAAIEQVVDIPATGHPMLRFWYRICSYDLIDFDYFAVYVSIWPHGPRNRVLIDGANAWKPNVLWTSGWKEGIVPLETYLGRTVTITLANVMDNADGWYNTWTFVDSVWLEERP